MKFSNALSSVFNVALATTIVIGSYAYAKNAEADAFLASFSEEEKYCLQQNVYFEARNQDILGQASVAWVTLNRVSSTSFPSTLCEVVWQNKQFSWTHDGKSDTPTELEAWSRAGHVVQMVLEDYIWGRGDPTHSATHYHATYVEPYWVKSYENTIQIGLHVFYK